MTILTTSTTGGKPIEEMGLKEEDLNYIALERV
jgi:hypothetical protein